MLHDTEQGLEKPSDLSNLLYLPSSERIPFLDDHEAVFDISTGSPWHCNCRAGPP
jgi:hypothetical protein